MTDDDDQGWTAPLRGECGRWRGFNREVRTCGHCPR